MTLCKRCGEETERLDSYCLDCAWLIDNYDPPDKDGEDIFRDYTAELRDAAEAAQRLKR